MSLTRDAVVTAALEVLEDEGLGGLTLRRVAARLGVSAPTLYWHVSSKQQLLDLMAARIGEVRSAGPDALRGPADADRVWAALAEQAREHRRTLLSHRDGALVVAGNRPTAAAMPGIERALEVLVEVGLDPTEALLAMIAVSTYVVGDALETARSRGRAPEEGGGALGNAVGSGEYPMLAAAALQMRAMALAEGVGAVDDARFELGLAALIDGLRRRPWQGQDHGRAARARRGLRRRPHDLPRRDHA